MALLPGDDKHTHVEYSDVFGATALQESIRLLANRVDILEEQIDKLWKYVDKVVNSGDA